MRKQLSLVLALCFAAGMALTACGGSGSAPASASSPTSESTAEPTTEPTAEPTAEPAETGRDILAEAAAIPFDPDSYTDIILDVPYMDDGEEYHLLDLYGTSQAETLPTVIEVHGGGFIGGTRENNAGHSIFFAERGYKVVAPDYGKVPRHGDFKETVQDLFAAFHWVEDNAGTYGFDLNNVFLSGDSAGGFYTLLCCAIFHSEELQEYFEVTLPGFEFLTYVTTCPAADFRGMREHLDASGPNGHVAKTIGADLLMDDDLMDHMDLMTNVDPAAFTGIFMNTTPGDTTTGAAVQTFEAYLNEKGIEHTMISYEDAENDIQHTFNISHADYAESKVANQDMVDYMNSYLR